MNIEINPKLIKCARVRNDKILYTCNLSEFEFKTKNYALAINRSNERFVKVERSVVDCTDKSASKIIYPS
jgi:hypothetical protein